MIFLSSRNRFEESDRKISLGSPGTRFEGIRRGPVSHTRSLQCLPSCGRIFPLRTEESLSRRMQSSGHPEFPARALFKAVVDSLGELADKIQRKEIDSLASHFGENLCVP